MTIAFESEGVGHSNRKLLVRGLIFLVVTVVVVGALIMKSEGVFQKKIGVTAVMSGVGDGLPTKSDVKFRGVLVGTVSSVGASVAGGPNRVKLDLLPHYAGSIPSSVTARVVPSNVFAVPSIQLVDNGKAPGLRDGSEIQEDRSLDTIRLETSLTALREIVAAAGRDGTDQTLGVLATFSKATSGRGKAAVQAGAQLSRIVTQLNTVVGPQGDDSRSTLSALSGAVTGLQKSAPDLLDAVHHAIVPMQTIAAQRAQLTSFLTGSLTTLGTMGTALDNNTGKLINITKQLSPAISVMADGSQNFTQMTRSITRITKNFDTFWDEKTQTGTGKVMVQFTPRREYTRADCPRYYELAGPSCFTAPTTEPTPQPLPASLNPKNFQPPAGLMGGNVGPVGSPQEQKQIGDLLGHAPQAASDLLLGPLARGSNITVAPAPDAAAQTQAPGEGGR